MSLIHQETEAVATRAWTEGRRVYVELTDQRVVGFPAHRFRRLNGASEAELAAHAEFVSALKAPLWHD